jgi:CheY-like chemotaxis protein
MDPQDPQRILIVDDEPLTAEYMERLLEPLPAKVEIRHDWDTALKFAQEWLPHLLILDVVLQGDVDGFEIARKLREVKPREVNRTAGIPILFVTGKRTKEIASRFSDLDSDSFLYRDDLSKYLLSQARSLLRRPSAPIYPLASPDATLSILCLPGSSELVMRLSGDTSRLEVAKCKEPITAASFVERGRWPVSTEWRAMASNYGSALFRSIFSSTEAIKLYSDAAGAAGGAANLRLQITAPDDLLRVPFEFLYEQKPPDDTFYLVLRHPFSRCVTGRNIKHLPLGRRFLNDLGKTTLRMLVIGSDPRGDLDKVRDEIESVKTKVESGFGSRGIRAQVEVIPPEAASYEEVCKALNRCEYHMVHFAGHGFYSPESPDASGLRLFSEGDHNREACLTADDLARLLRNSNVRFLYLSCCQGGEAAGTELQGHYDLLGLADGALRAGVPSVLTFRFAQKDVDMEALASTFYEELIKDGDPDRALRTTRDAKKVPAGNDRWISPVLFIQH